MITILHTSLSGGRVFLWGEGPGKDGAPLSKRRVRKPAQPYPYDAGADRIEDALERSSIPVIIRKERFCKMAVWLPSRKGVPIASSPLIAEPPAGKGKIETLPWIVTACPLETVDWVDLLCHSMNRPTLAGGVIVSPVLRFLSRCLRCAGAMVAEEKFLPGLVREERKYLAIWEPVPDDRDLEFLSSMAGEMPPALSFMTQPSDSSPPGAEARDLLQDFINKAVDYLVRSSCPEYLRGLREKKKKSRFESVHDAWLYSLRHADPMVSGRASDKKDLIQKLEEWRRPVSVVSRSPFRLCFRLEEPSRRDRWKVRFLIHPRKDPSLLVELGDAWKSRGRAVKALSRFGGNHRTYLLAALGRAASICPRVAESLKRERPDGYDIDTEAAFEFLTDRAPLLEQAGFGVLLPSWWAGRGTKKRLSLRAKIKGSPLSSGSKLTLRDMVRVDWTLAMGGDEISLEELEALARMKSPLVNLRGQWMEMNAEDIRAAIDFLRKKAGEEIPLEDVIHMAVGAEKAPGELDVEEIRAGGRIGTLLRGLGKKASFREIKAPAGFHGTLRPYQVRGYSWLAFLRQWGLGSCLADDMGLGKTIQTLALVQRDRESGEKRPVLLVCPTSVVNNWFREAARFTPGLSVMVHHGIGRKKGTRFQKDARKHAMVISSYGLLQRDLEFLREVPWSGVILDEAQNIKNPETRQSRAARSIEAEYRVALTGTPVENHVGDLWSIMDFLNPGLLGHRAWFRKSYFIPIQAGRDPDAAGRLHRITGPFILRRMKTDKAVISDLPEKMEMKVYCPLTKEQASLYRAVIDETERQLEKALGIQRKGLILATLSKLKQVCNHPVQFLGDNSRVQGRSGKLSRLSEMLEEILGVGDRALVFTQFAEMGRILKKYLQETFGREVFFLHGGVAKKKRDQMVERFQESGGPPVFLLSLKAGGTGLNLTRASHVFHFDRWWNPAVENQATDRAYRIGQEKRVQVHKFVCAGTLEEKIDDMIERKKQIAEKVVGAGEGWLTELSNEQLKDIFSLGKDAVGDE